MTNSGKRPIISATNNIMSTKPELPPLYFECMNHIVLECLPSEMLTNIISYLDWGDHARLAPVHSSFKSILHDVALSGGQASKWALCRMLIDGSNGLAPNPVLAVEYLKDLTGANLGEEDGSSIRKEIDEKIIKVNDESELRFTPAMRELATCYFSGLGIEKDALKGLDWLKIAYRNGDIDASNEIATIYETGKYGVPVEVYLAAKWFLIASNAGHVEAMAEYALCCELGCGVPQSDEKALDWYTKAAQKGHVISNYSVGQMFEEARGGLPQSDSEAVLWYYKAALMGDDDSKTAMTRLSDIARIVVPGWARTLNV